MKTIKTIWIYSAFSLFTFTLFCSCAGGTGSNDQLSVSFDPNEFVGMERYANDNGFRWFHFGSAVISSARSMYLEADNGKTYSLNESDKNFLEAKRWILFNFARKLNFSPKKPTFESREFPRWVLLYSSPVVPPDTTAGDDSDEFQRKVAVSQSHHIISIPIIPDTLGLEQAEVDRKYAELERFFKPNPH